MIRDIVSHHYEKVDHEIIFDICQNHLPQLQKTIQSMMK
ncbi:HepT-like ribonuclease domain-containing protein [uncultured Desulfobacter sp.]|nr:HepT-like ribonuclease domain-containing protein [uncultured Desulfobacter sp.]